MKTCSKCRVEKTRDEFRRASSKKDGLYPSCKECQRKYDMENKERNSARTRAHYKANPEKYAANFRAWRKANPERKAELGRSWAKDNPEKVAASCQAWREANKERKAALGRAWREANPEKCGAHNQNRRALKASAAGSHTASDIRAIFDSQRGLCASCEIKLFKDGSKKYHIDHIQPLSKGGSNDKYNIQILCQFCNLSKHNKEPAVWAAKNGKLL